MSRIAAAVPGDARLRVAGGPGEERRAILSEPPRWEDSFVQTASSEDAMEHTRRGQLISIFSKRNSNRELRPA